MLRGLLAFCLALGVSTTTWAETQFDIEQLDGLSNEELRELLTPEQQAVFDRETAKFKQRSEEILEETRQSLMRVEQNLVDQAEKKLVSELRDKLEAEEAELKRQIEEILVSQAFFVNLGVDTKWTGLLALSGNTAVCQHRKSKDYLLLTKLCEAQRLDGVPENMPLILDPLIAWHCSMPRPFAPEPIRKICDQSSAATATYHNPRSNPAYAAVEDLFRNYHEEKRREAEERRQRIERNQKLATSKQACGEHYRQAEMRDLMWVKSTADLSEIPGIQRRMVERVRACKEKYGIEDRALYKPKTFGYGTADKVNAEQYCRKYIRSYQKYIDQVSDWPRNKHEIGTPVRASVIATIAGCRKKYARR